jgi:hypothetical protein
VRTRSRVGFRHLYGARPQHLVWHLVAFGIAAFAFAQIFSGGGAGALVFWLVALVVGHDLIFVPAYVGADRVFRRTIARFSRPTARGVPLINHIRAPALISGLLLIIYLPLISGRSDLAYFRLSGHHLTDYLRNWLLITATLFLGSGLIYALRVGRARGRRAG